MDGDVTGDSIMLILYVACQRGTIWNRTRVRSLYQQHKKTAKHIASLFLKIKYTHREL